MSSPILVSLCLLGVPCRYDGKAKTYPELADFLENESVWHVALCPEEEGGLPTPRPPAEIQPDGRIVNRRGEDVTDYFRKGCEKVLSVVRRYHVRRAILKTLSPSCGYGKIYDGTFSGKCKQGNGLCAQMLKKEGVRIYNEKNWRDLLESHS